MTVIIQSEDPTPTLNITSKLSTVHGNASIHIKNPYNPEYDAAIIQCDLTIQMTLEI